MNATPYPVNLDLRGRRALVVGGGSVAAPEIEVHGVRGGVHTGRGSVKPDRSSRD